MMGPVIVAAGGTGGHVIPALAVAAELKRQDVPVVWLGTHAGLEARLVPAAGIDIRWISVAGLRGKSPLQRLIGPFKLVRSCFQSLRLVYLLKPRAVLGMGGFVSGPVGIAALVLRKPLVLHEQNAVAGMTNRWLSGLASRVYAAWPGAFPASVKEVVIGNPVARSIALLSEQEREVRRESTQPLRVLVVGGSRGARALNEIVPLAIALLDTEVDVHHQAGMQECNSVTTRYQQASKANCRVSEFIDDMAAAYQEADLVICRSGAMTVTEISAIGIPSILVPFPFAVDDHQTRNASQLATAGAAILLPQTGLTPEVLADTIKPFLTDRSVLKQMSNAARACFKPGAARVVAQALIEVAH